MDNQKPTETSKINNSEGRRTQRRPKALFIYLALALLAVLGTYFWQHQKYLSEVAKAKEANNKVNASNQKLTDANKKIKSLNTTISSLSAKDLQPPSTKSSSYDTAPLNLSLSVNGAARYTPDALDTDKNAGVAVSITLKNATSDTLNVNTSDYKLQDKDGNVYLVNGLQNNSLEQQYLPSGNVLLANQALARGQSVKGTIIFIVPNASLTAFSLQDGTSSYQVSVQ
jgi:cell division protein FtsL